MFEFRERRRFTPEEYLWLEERSETRNEYYDGEIFAMTGGSLNHNRILNNLLVELKVALRGHPCEVFQSDVRLFVEPHQLFTYPDLMVVCGPPMLLEDREDTLCDAKIIVEVLSESTASYDRMHKLHFYRALPSLHEYVLLEQHAARCETHAKQSGGGWLWSESETELSLPSVNLRIPLASIYQGVQLKAKRRARKSAGARRDKA